MTWNSMQYHVRAEQQEIVDQLVDPLPASVVDVRQLPDDPAELARIDELYERRFVDDALIDCFLVAPTDVAGWTVLVTDAVLDCEELSARLSAGLATTVIYGEYIDKAGTWRWLVAEHGDIRDGYWNLQRETEDAWIRYPDHHQRPAGALLLPEAFEQFGREYHHEVFTPSNLARRYGSGCVIIWSADQSLAGL